MKKTVVAKKLYGGTQEVDVENLQFRIAVYAVIIKDDKVLLTPWDDGWDFPGGGIEIDEGIEEALKREVLEETGMEIDRGPLVTVGDNFFIGSNPDKPKNSICIYYHGLNPRGDIENTNFTKSELEHSGPPKWFDIQEAKKLRFYASSIDPMEVLDKALKNES